MFSNRARIGLFPNTQFLKSSGIELDEFGFINTDERLMTSLPGVFTAGDVAEFFDIRIGRHNMEGNWFHALATGKRAALNMLG